MNKHIVALLDGSIYSASVCEHCAWAASRLGSKLELLHVLGRREASGSGDLSGSLALGARTALLQELAALDEQRAKLINQRGRAILDDARAMLEKAGISNVETRLRHGDLLETVEEVQASAGLLVMGKRGEAADFATGHLGSNLERVVRISKVPVLVASRALQPVRRILLAFDGGEASRRALQFLVSSPLYADMEILVASVGGMNDATYGLLAEAQGKLEAVGRPAIGVPLVGAPEQVLPQLVVERKIDMVVMGAYGHGRIRSMLIGSTTSEMIRTCLIPILLLR